MKCLVVDDEAGIREGLGALLRLRGHEVRTAGDCRTAVALLAEHEFDLVLTDWRLPDGTGAALYASGSAPIVAISGHTDEIEPSPRLCAVLQKPVLPDRLFALLAEHAAGLATAAAVVTPLAALPCDVGAALERALALLGDSATEVVDDGAFVTLHGPWPGDHVEAGFAELGGDLRVLAPGGQPRLELRWCRDGRPDVSVRTVGATEPWPEASELAVDFHGTGLEIEAFTPLLDRATAARRAGARIWFLNVGAALRSELARLGRSGELPPSPRIGPSLPGPLAELWR